MVSVEAMALIKEEAARVEKHSDRLMQAIQMVSDDVKELATAIAKGFAHQVPGPPAYRNGSIFNGSGQSVLTTLLALLAIIAGVFAMVQPMQQQIEFQNEAINSIKSELQLDDQREVRDQGRLSVVERGFREIETQHVGLRREHILDVDRLIDNINQHREMTDRIVDLRRSRAKDEHRAMMREDSLRLGDIDHRLTRMEKYPHSHPPHAERGSGSWEQLFKDEPAQE